MPFRSPLCPKKKLSALPQELIGEFLLVKSNYGIHEDLVLKAHLFWFHVCVSLFKRKKDLKRKIEGMLQISFHSTSPFSRQVMALRVPF